MKHILLVFVFIQFCIASIAQQASYFDPAQAYNRLLIEKNSGAYTKVGRYNVIGSSYLFGQKHSGHLFAKGETAYNIQISYNAHTQEIEFYSSANSDKPLVKDANMVDSFIIKANTEFSMMEPLKFINGSHLGQSDKSFYQVVYSGTEFNLYKLYKANLGIVSTNYVDAELRQFEIMFDYYYSNTATKDFKKIKLNLAAVKKEFKEHEDVSTILADNTFFYNPEEKLKLIFASLNK